MLTERIHYNNYSKFHVKIQVLEETFSSSFRIAFYWYIDTYNAFNTTMLVNILELITRDAF